MLSAVESTTTAVKAVSATRHEASVVTPTPSYTPTPMASMTSNSLDARTPPTSSVGSSPRDLGGVDEREEGAQPVGRGEETETVVTTSSRRAVPPCPPCSSRPTHICPMWLWTSPEAMLTGQVNLILRHILPLHSDPLLRGQYNYFFLRL
jgi:hypothetical protein